MLRVVQCKCDLDADKNQLRSVIAKKLKTKKTFQYKIVKRSLDAREKLCYSYQVNVIIDQEEKYLHLKDVSLAKDEDYKPILNVKMDQRPVVIGFGPAGMFAALTLAYAGTCPIVYERGSCVEKRTEDVEHFWKTGELNTESNVQFGEGGAGTFSDGKLTSRSKDPRSQHVLEELVKYGADEEILIDAMPHIGTDQLKGIVRNIRQAILDMGGEIHFDSRVDDIRIENDHITQIHVNDKWIDADDVVLAIGHSSRDTFEMLNQREVFMEPKPFAVGVRIEHLQSLINMNQYHCEDTSLPAASYRLTTHTSSQRGVYSFCMCPGGQVVAATSTPHQVVTNGMSYHARDLENANSALLIQITPEDVGQGLFDGMNYQIELEKKAFKLGGNDYKAPCQKVTDYLANKPSVQAGNVKPTYSRGVTYCDLHELFDDFINQALHEALIDFDRKIKGFANEDAIMTAVESRSTSPIRIRRHHDSGQSINIPNLYPCGEGAGYAGGIVSAAIDGIRIAEQILLKNKGERV